MARNARKADPVDKALVRVAKARRRLDDDQGIVARRNARTEILTSLRELRRVIDLAYPVIQKKRRPRRKHPKVRKGYVLMTEHASGEHYRIWLEWIAAAGVPVQKINKATPSTPEGAYVPEWAVAICSRYQRRKNGATSALRRARRERNFRDVELSAYKLKRDKL